MVVVMALPPTLQVIRMHCVVERRYLVNSSLEGATRATPRTSFCWAAQGESAITFYFINSNDTLWPLRDYHHPCFTVIAC